MGFWRAKHPLLCTPHIKVRRLTFTTCNMGISCRSFGYKLKSRYTYLDDHPLWLDLMTDLFIKKQRMTDKLAICPRAQRENWTDKFSRSLRPFPSHFSHGRLTKWTVARDGHKVVTTERLKHESSSLLLRLALHLLVVYLESHYLLLRAIFL